jgi:SSS family solute:Na+ symporter
MAVTVQLFAGGSLVSLLTGIPLINVMIVMSLIVLAYSWISGLQSSIITDFIQFVFVVIGIGIIIPRVIVAAG